MGRVRIASGEWLRYFSWYDGMCSVNSLGVTALPASSNATFIPASESRFAAQPPVAPEPTTIASYVSSRTSCVMESLFVSRLVRSQVSRLCCRCGAPAVVVEIVVGALAPAEFLLTDFRSIVGGGNQGFEPFEMLLSRIGLSLVLTPPMAGFPRVSPRG